MRHHKSTKTMNIFSAALGLVLLAAFCYGQQYECRTGRSCRCSPSNPCEHKSKYGFSLAECREECNGGGDDCKGFEWTSNISDSDDENHCEIHEVAGNRYSHQSQVRSDTVCCWRDPANPTPRPPTPRPSPAPTDSKINKGGKRQRNRTRQFLRTLRFENDSEQKEIHVVVNN